MIVAEFRTDSKDRTVAMTVTGHAGAAVYGQDIVCSAASILAYALGQDIINHHATGAIKHSPHIEEDDGKLVVIASADNTAEFVALSIAFGVARTGFALLSMQYPEYVRMNQIIDDNSETEKS